MILQALNEYYQRKVDQGTHELPELGFELKKIPHVFELNANGELIQIKSYDPN